MCKIFFASLIIHWNPPSLIISSDYRICKIVYTILIFLYTCTVFLFVVIYMVILRLITTSVVEIHTERRRTQMSERKLVGTGEMFKKALAGKYAIGAYNVNNMEILQGIAEAA